MHQLTVLLCVILLICQREYITPHLVPLCLPDTML